MNTTLLIIIFNVYTSMLVFVSFRICVAAANTVRVCFVVLEAHRGTWVK